MKNIFLTLFFVMIAMPVMAEQTDLSPLKIEALPFDTMNAAQPNIEELLNDIEPLAGDHAPAEEKGGLPQFDVTTFSSQIFWLAVMFVILYVFFSKSALPKLSSVIDQRRLTIRSDLEQADTLAADIDKTRNEYETAMGEAQALSRDTIASVEQELRAEADKQFNEFKAKEASEVQSLETKAENAKAQIKSELNDIAIELTTDVVNKIGVSKIKDADIANAVSSHIELSTNTKKKAA